MPKMSSDSEAQLHRALADPSRVKILETIRRGDSPRDAKQLAQAVGLHPNTVRSHLRRLEAAGLVRARRDAQGKPGRPHLVFEGTQKADEEGGTLEAYRLLANALAQSVSADGPDPSTRAESAAHALAGDHPSEGGSVGHAVRFLSRLGFDPTVRERGATSTEIVMRACPFEDLGPDQLELACSVHRGLIRGLLRPETGTEHTVVELHAEPGNCVARLAAAG